MNRVSCFLLALLSSALLCAQPGKETYVIWSHDSYYEPHDVVRFFPGDTITVNETSAIEILYYNPQKHINGQRRKVALMQAGTFEISDFYSRGKNPVGGGGSEKGVSTAAADPGGKADDEAYASVVAGIGQFLQDSDKPLFGCGAISAKRGEGSVTVVNRSENDLFFDIIWIQGGRCLSAISFAKDFRSDCLLAPGETYEMKINSFAERQPLYLIATPEPIKYNLIDFSKYNDLPDPPAGTFSLSIIKVEE